MSEVKTAASPCTARACSQELILILISVLQVPAVHQTWLSTELKPLILGDV